MPDIAKVGHIDPIMSFISIRLDPRLPLVVPRYHRNVIYSAYIVKIGPKSPLFALNRWFLPDIAWVGSIDPYNELYKYQFGPYNTSSGS